MRSDHLKCLRRPMSSRCDSPSACSSLKSISRSAKLQDSNEARVSLSRIPTFQNRFIWSGESILGDSDNKNCFTSGDIVKTSDDIDALSVLLEDTVEADEDDSRDKFGGIFSFVARFEAENSVQRAGGMKVLSHSCNPGADVWVEGGC